MWNKTTQSDQEAMGPSSKNKPHPAHSSMQPGQHGNPEKPSASGRVEYVSMHL